MKISCVHTGAGERIFGIMERELKKRIEVPFVVTHMTDPELIARISGNGRIEAKDAAELMRMYNMCADQGADIIINMCSSVGEIAEAAAPILEIMGVKMIRIDRRMCEEAVREYEKIVVVATLSSTLEPSCRLLAACAQEQGKDIEIIPVLAEGMFGKGPEELAEAIWEKLSGKAGQFEAVVLAQNSMTEAAAALAGFSGKKVYASPAYAAIEAAEAVNQ